MQQLIFICGGKDVRVFHNNQLDCVQVLRRHETYGSQYDAVGLYDKHFESIGGGDVLTKGQKAKLKDEVLAYYQEV